MHRPLLVLALIAFSTSAFAQDTATAETLFKHGLAELKAGNYAKACPALDESFRLDPRAGTLFTAAECDLAWGKSATAMARFDEFLSFVDKLPADQRTKQAERVRVAKDRKHQLETEVPRLTIQVANPPDGLVVKRDEAIQRAATFGIPLPVDPGDHLVTAEAPGRTTRSWKLSLAKRASETVSITLELAPAAAPAASTTAVVAVVPAAR